MKFRTRLALLISITTAVTLGAAFTAVAVVFVRSEERELDESVREAARDELRELAQRRGASFHLSAIDGPPGDDAAPLERFAALYDHEALVETTDPSCAPKAQPTNGLGVIFGWQCGKTHMSAVVMPLLTRPTHRLLIALPRTNLESDTLFLERTMAIALLIAVGAATGVTALVVRRLTHQHDAIAATARLVAGGDLAARVPERSRDAELVQLTHDINTMIDRLGTLVESQKRFIAHAAHELRSPLTSLLGELSLATRRERKPEEYKLAIDEALVATRRLKILTEDLLTIARLGSQATGQPEQVELSALVQEALSLVRSVATEKEVSITCALEEVAIRGRARDLVRLMRNLLDNALQHCPSGGEINVRLHPSGDHAELSVEDSGAGIPASEREKIFEPFYRRPADLAREHAGAGLGLAIVREIVLAHCGTIVAERGTPGGARFVVRLPIAAPSRADDDDAPGVPGVAT